MSLKGLNQTLELLKEAGIKEMRIRALSGQDMLVDTNSLLKQNKHYANSLSKRSPKNLLKIREEFGVGRNSGSVSRQPASPMRKKSQMTHQTFKSFFNAKSTTDAFRSARNIDPTKRPKLKKPK